MNFKIAKQNLKQIETDSGNSSSFDILKRKKARKSKSENVSFAQCRALSSFVVETPVCSVRVSHCSSGLHELDLFNERDLPESSSEDRYTTHVCMSSFLCFTYLEMLFDLRVREYFVKNPKLHIGIEDVKKATRDESSERRDDAHYLRLASALSQSRVESC